MYTEKERETAGVRLMNTLLLYIRKKKCPVKSPEAKTYYFYSGNDSAQFVSSELASPFIHTHTHTSYYTCVRPS